MKLVKNIITIDGPSGVGKGTLAFLLAKRLGWNVLDIDGHNHDEIVDSCLNARNQSDSPTMIIANTIKGKGVSFMEDDNNWHYRIPTIEEVKQSFEELGIK